MVQDLNYKQWLNSAGTGRNAIPAPPAGVSPPLVGVLACSG